MEPRRSTVLFLQHELFRETSQFYESRTYSIRSGLRLLVIWSFCCFLKRVCPMGLRISGFRFACSYVPYWCSMFLSALVHYCHMTSPSLLQTVSQCCEVLQIGSLLYVSIHKTVTLLVLSNVCESRPQHFKRWWRTSIYFGQEPKRVVWTSQEEETCNWRKLHN